jgi:hypothetical protein
MFLEYSKANLADRIRNLIRTDKKEGTAMDKKRCFNFHLAPAMHGAPINFVPGHNGNGTCNLRLHSARLI